MGADVARTLTGQYRVSAHEGGHPFTQRPTSVVSDTGVPGAILADEAAQHRRIVPAAHEDQARIAIGVGPEPAGISYRAWQAFSTVVTLSSQPVPASGTAAAHPRASNW